MTSKRTKQVRHKAGGYTFFLKSLPQGALMMALSEADKPDAPMVEVQFAGGTTAMQPNRNDKKYQSELETWAAQYNSRLFRLCVTRGIDHVEDARGGVAAPSTDELEDVRFVYGSGISHRAALHYWHADLIGDTAKGFMNLVLGQSEVTEEGLEEAEDRFRGNGEGPGVERED